MQEIDNIIHDSKLQEAINLVTINLGEKVLTPQIIETRI